MLWKQNSKTVLSWYDDTITIDRLLLLVLLFSYWKLEQGGRIVQAQQGAGTAVTVVLARFISVSGLCSPLIFVIHAIHITIWNCKKCINMLDTFYCVKTKICTKQFNMILVFILFISFLNVMTCTWNDKKLLSSCRILHSIMRLRCPLDLDTWSDRQNECWCGAQWQ